MLVEASCQNNLLMICWSSDFLDSWDFRFVRFLNNTASNFAVSSVWRTSPWSSAFLCQSHSISGPVAGWAARDSSNISRCFCVSWINPVKCWCSPAHSWLCCCVTSSEYSAWRLNSVRKSCSCSSRLHTSDVTWFASWENHDKFWEKSRVCIMFVLPHLHLHIIIVCFTISCQFIDKVLLRSRFILMSGSKNFSSLDGREHVEAFRADHSELLVLVVFPIEQFLGVQELQVHSEDM